MSEFRNISSFVFDDLGVLLVVNVEFMSLKQKDMQVVDVMKKTTRVHSRR
jgi:hypothetical protein